jgi:GalNAc-alpha-(1->4)-GalNAc-alpha-(1->3)-diNAcBac-PP-undecaprenol alpha-1,4-N-acetyl-D-galactosaminyltransferase
MPMARGSPRRLLLVTGTLECGGAERQLAEMANYWAERGVDVSLATWSGPQIRDFYRLDGRIRRVHLGVASGGRLRGNLGRILKLRKLMRNTAPDAALSFLTRSNVPTILAGIGLPLRVVISERVQPAHETGLQLAWRILRRFVYRQAAAIVSQTTGAAEWIRSNLGAKVLVIPNALRPLPAESDVREPLVVGIGRLVPQKGFDLLLRAFAQVESAHPEWRVAIAGEGPERKALERLSAELGVRGRVDFVGHVREVESLMARASLVVQPSRYEGFPNAVLESMGMGAAVISADCPAGPAELIEDGINGRLVPVEDIDALAQAMAELMGEPALRLRLGREATRVRERFRQDSIMAQWEAVLVPA